MGAFSEAPARADPALSFDAAYTGEVWSNIRGGIERDTAYLDNFDLVATLDAERLGWTGTTIVVSALYNNRTTFSETIVGDLQTISNIETAGSLRPYEAWIERRFGAAAVKVGLIDLNSEFDVNKSGSLFINSSHGIGPDFSQVGETGPSIFPLTGLGALARVAPAPGWTLSAGIFEGTPGNPDRPRRIALNIDDYEGALLVGEIGHRIGEEGRFALGAWRHTGGRVVPVDSNRSDSASTGAYFHIEGPIAKAGSLDIVGFARVGFADPGVHRIARYTGTGLIVSGPMMAEDDRDEQVGIAIGAAANGDAFRRSQNAAGRPVERRETIVELTYRIHINDYLALQPDLQYVFNPGTDPARANALAAGLRFELTWQSGR